MVGTTVVPCSFDSSPLSSSICAASSTEALTPFSGSRPACAARPIALISYIAVPLRPVLTFPSSEASKTRTAAAFFDTSLIKSRDAKLPVSSSVVAISATGPSIPFSANSAWVNPTFISNVPGPRITSPSICQMGSKEPIGQTVSKCASKTTLGFLSPHQKIGRPFTSSI